MTAHWTWQKEQQIIEKGTILHGKRYSINYFCVSAKGALNQMSLPQSWLPF
jgi:hypothetical protein